MAASVSMEGKEDGFGFTPMSVQQGGHSPRPYQGVVYRMQKQAGDPRRQAAQSQL